MNFFLIIRVNLLPGLMLDRGCLLKRGLVSSCFLEALVKLYFQGNSLKLRHAEVIFGGNALFCTIITVFLQSIGFMILGSAIS